MINSASKNRSNNYISQVKIGTIYKAIGMVASFISIPIMIKYLGQEKFGIWSTILTVISWMLFFDLGISNGLRNKVAESLAQNNKKDAQLFISSGVILTGIIAVILGLLIIGSASFLNWQTIFNTKSINEYSLRTTIQIVTFFIVINFWLGTIGAILTALQNTAQIALGQMMSNLIALGFVFFLSKTTQSSIVYLAFAYGISLISSNILLGFILFKKHTDLMPKYYVNKKHINPLLSTGIQFFIIQLAVLIIFTTDKMLITQFFGPKYVTEYDVIFRFFSVISISHTIISTPLNSAYTEAFYQKDTAWIRRVLKNQIKIFIAITVVTIIMIFGAKTAIRIWIGKDLLISMGLVFATAIYTLISIWNNIFGQILSGLSKIRLGSLYTIITAIINIPISYYFGVVLGYGVTGILLGTISSILISSIISPIQVWYFIYSRRKIKILDKILQ